MDEGRLVEVALDAARAAAEVHRRHLGRVDTDAWQSKATTCTWWAAIRTTG